ncbi:MAG: transglutaminase family protein [Pseudomonadota bacterium]
MTIRVGITHHTAYQYDRAINMSPHVFRLRPAPHSRTPIVSHSLKIRPENHFINWQQDPFGNYLARVVFPEPTRSFSFTVDVVADLTVINPFDFFLDESVEKFPFEYDKRTLHDVLPYLEKIELGEDVHKLIEQCKPQKPIQTVDFLVEVNQAIYKLVNYNIRLDPGVQTPDQTLKLKSGSCRDSSWLLVQIFRYLGLAARFVSGYLVQLTPDVKNLDGPSGPEEDFTDLHAWCEVYIPGAGWIGLDPTSGLFAGEGHIPLACTPEPSSAAPVTGAIDNCESTLNYSNEVRRLHEPPRVTKPYTEAQWSGIQQLGDSIDKTLERLGIELTMGGEPTFISIDDMESEQWNTAADGPEKRALAYNIFTRMTNAFTTGGFSHFGQGKWYPGEPLPRWQYAHYWRKDGEAIWENLDLLADPTDSGNSTVSQVSELAKGLVAQLGLDQSVIVNAYEDVIYHLWQEGSLPVDMDIEPEQDALLDAMSRQQFLAKMERGIDKPVGVVIPLAYDEHYKGWQSSHWSFRRKHCFLMPGDSPMGYRLPLKSVGTPAFLPDRDPSAIPEAFAALPKKQKGYTGDKTLLTAICIEIRNGNMCVFMPPLEAFEHYALLLNALESVAASMQTQLVIEGYTPPFDSRVDKFAVTPDPGVIEVNIHPMSNWRSLVNTVTQLYELARESRLSTEKFMLDGRHTGTGGGNHVTMGGANVLKSPFIRRPDVLRSFITFWQHHPGLSYLFSSLFIGPTSQAPRVDEARDERLYELEIAFSQIPTGEVQQPWVADRLLRHLLTDLTGNTHRAEFCIDKLYSPDSATGRLGLVEFRGFEMPPHAQMSLMQMLFLRTLLAWFWEKPYHRKLKRWGTALHDKFLLPYFVQQDIKDVCQQLQSDGFGIKFDWFDPFFEFRFPRVGRRQISELKLELFTAIEPWHVLGEEMSTSGTSRFVDSSLERVQLNVSNITEDRYVISCNGRKVPLTYDPTGSIAIAGIRFRAWQPPSALHPTIGVHAPLVFDVYDKWSGRSIGGFTYHVSHPGGRNFTTYPINAFEAEGRRIARFWDHGHTPPNLFVPADEKIDDADMRQWQRRQGKEFKIPEDEVAHPEYPFTLDLRRPPNA